MNKQVGLIRKVVAISAPRQPYYLDHPVDVLVEFDDGFVAAFPCEGHIPVVGQEIFIVGPIFQRLVFE